MLSNNIRKNSINDVFTSIVPTDEFCTSITPSDFNLKKIGNVVNFAYRKGSMVGQVANGTLCHIPLEYAPITNLVLMALIRIESDGTWRPTFIQIQRDGAVNFYYSGSITISDIVCYGCYGC